MGTLEGKTQSAGGMGKGGGGSPESQGEGGGRDTRRDPARLSSGVGRRHGECGKNPEC